MAVTVVAPTGLVDAFGRAISAVPASIGHLLLVLDRDLADLGMRFNIECQDCSQQAGRPVYVMPQTNDGKVEFLCPHHRRIADLKGTT